MELVGVLLRRWKILLLSMVLGAGIIYAVALATDKPQYSVTVRTMLSLNLPKEQPPTVISQLDYFTTQAVSILNTPTVLDQILKSGGFSAGKQLDASIKITKTAGSIFDVSVQSGSPDTAVNVANLIASKAVPVLQPLNVPLKTTTVQAAKATAVAGVGRTTRTAFGALAGLIVAVCVLLLLYYWKDTIKGEAEAFDLLRLPVVARFRGKGRSDTNLLETMVQYRRDGSRPAVLCLASADGSGNALDLSLRVGGYALSGGKRTLLLDLTVPRSPGHDALPPLGIRDVLDGRSTVEEAAHTLPGRDSLPILSLVSGEAAYKPLEAEDCRRLLDEAKARYDTVVVHAPDLKRHPEAVCAAALADQAFFVVHIQQTNAKEAGAALALLRSAEVPIHGCILSY